MTLTIEDDGTAVVRLDRPHARNAIDTETAVGLRDAVLACQRDQEVSAVVLTGGADVFCAGGDLKEARPASRSVFAVAHRLDLVQEVVRSLAVMTKPSVAAVEGYAIGGGWSLALACQYVVAGRSARFRSPFLGLGLLPDGGLAWNMAQRIGGGLTRSLLANDCSLEATDAADLGLVDRIADDGLALAEALTLVREVVPVEADHRMLFEELVHAAPGASLEEFLALERSAVALNGRLMADARDASIRTDAP